MKLLLFICLSFAGFAAAAQNLQLHYDFRHSLDPQNNAKNYPTLYFEYFKILDSGKAFIKPGAFLIKMQADLAGDQNDIGNYFMQVSQDFRFWKPKVYLSFQYSGGLGVTTPREYSYYDMNTYSAGCSYPFRFGKGYFSSILYFRYVPYKRPSKDFLYTFYFYRGFLNYKLSFIGDFSIWTENRNHGDALTEGLAGKQYYFFAEPQLWLKLSKTVSIGTKTNMYYHVLTAGNYLQVYPTAAVKFSL